MDSSLYFSMAGYTKHYQTLPRRRKQCFDHLYHSHTVVPGLPPSGRMLRSTQSPSSSLSGRSMTPQSPSSSSPNTSQHHLQVCIVDDHISVSANRMLLHINNFAYIYLVAQRSITLFDMLGYSSQRLQCIQDSAQTFTGI